MLLPWKEGLNMVPLMIHLIRYTKINFQNYTHAQSSVVVVTMFHMQEMTFLSNKLIQSGVKDLITLVILRHPYTVRIAI